jgi:hypothetical protein
MEDPAVAEILITEPEEKVYIRVLVISVDQDKDTMPHKVLIGKAVVVQVVPLQLMQVDRERLTI